MTQALWFLRFEGRIVGPYPARHIREWMRDGSITPQWEISLDERDWLSIEDSGQFREDYTIPAADANSAAWQRERERARQRWLEEDSRIETVQPQGAERAELARRSLELDHARTDALVQAEASRRPAYWMGALGVLALAAIGVAVWWGQQQEPGISAGISLKARADCAAPLADGVNWQGCDKHGLDLSRKKAHRAHLEQVRLDDAKLIQADLSDAVMTGISLRNADLTGANLSGANLSGADLRGANLAGAVLSYAVLRDAHLDGVRWEGARLDRTVWADGRPCAEISVGQCQ